jgi:hypothetical protein
MIDEDERVAVLADYLTKPKSSTIFFEDSVLEISRVSSEGIRGFPVFNVCMLESDASLLFRWWMCYLD